MTQEEINRKFHQLGPEAQKNFVKNPPNTSGLRRYEVGRSQERNQPPELSQSTQQQNDSSICTCVQVMFICLLHFQKCLNLKKKIVYVIYRRSSAYAVF